MKIGALIISFIVIVIFPRQLNGADYTTSEIALLTDIAYKSAYYGGEAVYIARAMLGLELLDPEITLRKRHPNSIAAIANTNQYFYPNPASDKIHIEYPHNEGDKMEFILSDMSGRMIMKKEIALDEVSLKGILSGAYIVDIFLNNDLKLKTKLIIE